MTVTPANAGRIFDKVGLVCDEQQATSIFRAHGLDQRGVNLQHFTSRLLNADTDRLARQQQRLSPEFRQQLRENTTRMRAEAAPNGVADRFQIARMADRAWQDHAAKSSAVAAGKPSGALPPIGGVSPIC